VCRVRSDPAADGQQKQGEAHPNDAQIRRERQNVRRGDEMDTEIAFPPDAVRDPAQRISEAAPKRGYFI